MANVLADVLATFTLIDSKYNDMLNACTTDQQRSALQTQYEAAQNAYDTCVNQTLEANDAQVASLSTDLKAANAQIEKSVNQLEDISKVINDISTAVNIGSQLAAKAAL